MSSNNQDNVDFFSGQWTFVRSVPTVEYLPAEGSPEIAFIGRSNTGKSSLINALIGTTGLARVSNTPGRTKQLNFFMPKSDEQIDNINPPVILVDMPGYGFAKSSKKEIDRWMQLVFDYLRGRSILKRVYLLVDSRRGIKSNDANVTKILDMAAISYQIILTKIDKIRKDNLESLLSNTQQLIIKHTAAHPEIIATSSKNKIGIKRLRETIKKLISEIKIRDLYTES